MRSAWAMVMGAALAALVCALLAPFALDLVASSDLLTARRGSQVPSQPLVDGPDPMERVSKAFVRYRENAGDWPCGWSGSSSSATTFIGFRCLGDDADVLDPWGRVFRVVFQAPTKRIPGAEQGAIALISAGPDGYLQTSDTLAVQGHAVGDDRVRVIARGVQ